MRRVKLALMSRFKEKPAAEASSVRRALRARRAPPPRHSARFAIVVGLVVGVYAVIGGRLLFWGTVPEGASTGGFGSSVAARPDLLDRNGEVLATDIRTASLLAEPSRIVDVDRTATSLVSVLPDLDAKGLRARLSGGAGVVWLKRRLTSRQEAEIVALNLPGIDIRTEKRRFYPGRETASHVVGLVNAKNQGIAGIETYVDAEVARSARRASDARGETLGPVRLSLDLRVQHILRDEVAAALRRSDAVAAGGVILDVDTGEVLAMASLPDYDPNAPKEAPTSAKLNRMSAATFEMGSTFKTFTTAMALDSGLVKITDSFDASRPIHLGGVAVADPQGRHRMLTVPEIFEDSSNIGAARQADIVGVDAHKAFLTKIGLLTRLRTELPETATPIQPKVWRKLNSIAISLGHGVSTTPLQTASAAAALVNGGRLIPPTFLMRSREAADRLAKVVIKRRTSDEMRYLFDLNGQNGSGKGAEVAGYRVGGRTSTTEKLVAGRHSAVKRFNAYLAAFPMDRPRYVVLVVLDEPKAEEGRSSATAGLDAAPTVGAIIRRSAALLKVKPDFGSNGAPRLVSY